MADMKQIFTYPNNLSSDYIDPDYYGNSTSGLVKRVDELLDGTYRSWSNLDPVSDLSTTNSEAMQDMSKFINYLEAKKADANLTFYDYWYNPIVTGTLTLIGGSAVSSVDYTAPPSTEETIFTTSSAHSFNDSDLLILSNFDGQMAQYNGDTFYVKVLTSTTLQLATDSALTNLLIVGANERGTFDSAGWHVVDTTPVVGGWGKIPDQSPIVDLTNFVPDAGYNVIQSVSDGAGIQFHTIEKNGTGLIGNTYYLKNDGGFTYKMYTDVGLTSPVLGSSVSGLTNYKIKAQITASSGSISLPNQAFSADYPYMSIDTENALDTAEYYYKLPNTQKTFTGTGFTNQNSTFEFTPINGNTREYINANAMPSTAFPGATSGVQVEYQTYQSDFLTDWSIFNQYNFMDFSNDKPRMHFFHPVIEDVINSPTLRYQWSVISNTGSRWRQYDDEAWHNLKIFDGFKFDNITYEYDGLTPDDAEIVYTQQGYPVLDPKTETLTFNSSTGTSAGSFLTKDTNTWQQWDYLFPAPSNPSGPSFYPKSGAPNMNVVIWKPGTNLDDYRMSFDDYGVLNLHSKDGSNNWTVPEYAEATCTDPQACTSWSFTGHGTGAPAFVVTLGVYQDVINAPYTFRLWTKSAPNTSTSTPLNYQAFNALWGTSYDANSSIDVQISPMPHALGNGVTTSTQSYGQYYLTASAYSDPNNLEDPNYTDRIPWGYSSAASQSGPTYWHGITKFVNTITQNNGYWPTLFAHINEVEISPLVTGDINATIIPGNAQVATQGDLAVDSSFPYPFEMSAIDITLPGNEAYTYLDTNGDTQPGAVIDTIRYWKAGATAPTLTTTTGETAPDVTVGVNSSGYLNTITLGSNKGRFQTGDDILFQIDSEADTYFPPSQTIAEQQDNWDTNDEWASAGFDTRKEWPHHVTPASAEINYNSPTITNNSQSGIKYTRSVGHTKWTLDVTYPPMDADDFKKFHAIAQAAQGQSIPFYFVLQNKDGVSILWKEWSNLVNGQPRFRNSYDAGSTTVLLEGFDSDASNVFLQGEVFVDGANENGALHTCLNDVNSNIFGEAKIRLAYPLRNLSGAGQKLYKNPYHAIVTLSSDNFTYSVDQNGYYYISVQFDLDGWK